MAAKRFSLERVTKRRRLRSVGFHRVLWSSRRVPINTVILTVCILLQLEMIFFGISPPIPFLFAIFDGMLLLVYSSDIPFTIEHVFGIINPDEV